MNYRDPDLLGRLAAEYALGTLRGNARRRFDQLLRSNAPAREQLDFWELRLSEFGQAIAPVQPPPAIRVELLERLDPQRAHAMPAAVPRPIQPQQPALRRRARFWLATAAAVVLAFLIGQHNPVHAPITGPDRTTASTDQAVPIYVAQMQAAASSMRWLISVSPDHQQLSVIAADDYLTLGRHSVQLWWISKQRGPVALGLLPCNRDGSTTIPIPQGLSSEAVVTFSISLEPQGGSATGRPTSVLSSAAIKDSI